MYPLIDVIVPFYNADKYLQDCLTSIVEQTYENIRILAINDGSTDSSIDIVRQFQQQYRNIDILEQENHGIGYTRNVALRNLRGEYVVFVDADDSIEKDYIMKLWKKISETEADIAVGNLKSPSGVMFLQDIKKDIIDIEDRNDFYEKFVIYNRLVYCVTNKMFRVTSLIESQIMFDDSCRYGEDLLFLCKLYTYVKRVVIEEDSCYNYRYNPKSITRIQKPDRGYEQFKIFELFYDYIKREKREIEYKQTTGKMLWLFVISSINLSLREGATNQQIIELCKYMVQSKPYKEIKKNGFLLISMYEWVRIECPNVLKRPMILCIILPILNKSWRILKLFLLWRRVYASKKFDI